MDLQRHRNASSDLPLVSVITPTKGRREFISRLLASFLVQDYPNRELILVEDGEDDVRDILSERALQIDGPALNQFLLPAENSGWRTYVPVRYFRHHASLGECLNKAIQEARGEFCCRFDDDDWQAPDRISKQMALARLTGRAVAASSNGLYWAEGSPFVYEHTGDAWRCSGFSHFFRRDYALSHPHADVSKGEDWIFIEEAYNRRALAAISGAEWMLARNHNGNTCSRRFDDPDEREMLLLTDNWRQLRFQDVAHIVEPILSATSVA